MPPPELDHEFLWHLLEHIPAMVWMTDADQSCIYANQSTLAFTGFSLSQMLGSGWRDTVHPDDLVPLELNFELHREDRPPLSAEVRNRRHDGEYRWMQVRRQPLFHKDGTFRGTIGLSLDITDAKRHESELARMITHDKLTGLPNRALLESLIEAAIDNTRSEGRKVPVLTFGVDRFQTINETQGHGAGDALLGEIGRRIGLMRHGHEIAGHLSGNRFVMIGEAGASTENAYRAAGHWDRASRAVASAIISLAAELGLDVVAEGVETREQLNVLRALKCTVVQGFLTGRPVPADEAAELLRHPAPIPTARGLI